MNISNSTSNQFFICPDRIFSDNDLTVHEIKIYMIIHSYMISTQTCYMTNAGLAKRLDVEIRSVQRALDVLEKKGYMRRFSKNGIRYLETVMTSIEDRNIDDNSIPPPHDNSVTPPMTILSPPHDNSVTHNKINTIRSDNNINTIGHSSNEPIKKPKIYRDDERFMRFYNLYPKKKKPQDAYKAFRELNPDEVLLARILDDIVSKTRFEASWSIPQYIPYPASYLRSRDFESEITKISDAQRKWGDGYDHHNTEWINNLNTIL